MERERETLSLNAEERKGLSEPIPESFYALATGKKREREERVVESDTNVQRVCEILLWVPFLWAGKSCDIIFPYNFTHSRRKRNSRKIRSLLGENMLRYN